MYGLTPVPRVRIPPSPPAPAIPITCGLLDRGWLHGQIVFYCPICVRLNRAGFRDVVFQLSHRVSNVGRGDLPLRRSASPKWENRLSSFGIEIRNDIGKSKWNARPRNLLTVGVSTSLSLIGTRSGALACSPYEPNAGSRTTFHPPCLAGVLVEEEGMDMCSHPVLDGARW